MAATKISALGTLAQDSIAPANDLFNLVDVSDTTMGAGGTNKKATIKSTISKSLDDLAATWNNAGVDFTAIKMNVTDTASGSGSLLLDLQVGGSSKLSVAKGGRVALSFGGSSNPSTFSSPALTLGGVTNSGFGRVTGGVFTSVNGVTAFVVNQNEVRVKSSLPFGFSSGEDAGSTGNDLQIWRDAANVLAQRNGANAQEFRLYNTYTDASNYERGFFRWNSNVFEIGTAAAGTGSNRILRFDTGAAGTTIQLYTGGSPRVLVSSNGVDIVNLPLRASTSGGSSDLGANGREFRDLYIYRNAYLTGLPTSDPAVAGQLWNDGGTVKVSAG